MAIAEKATRKEPNDRYPSSSALAEEPRRYLSGGRGAMRSRREPTEVMSMSRTTPYIHSPMEPKE